MHRFRYDTLEKSQVGDLLRLEKNEANHLFRILRAVPGEKVELMDGCGRIARAEVVPDKLLKLEEIRFYPQTESFVTLYLAVPKKQKNDTLLKQITELGVRRIQPLLCEHSVVIPDPDSIHGRWQELLFEACKQSGNPYLPEVSEPLKFDAAVKDAVQHCSKVFYGSPRVAGEKSGELCGNIGFFVGPEGGFSAAEEDLMEQNLFESLRIGSWILRVETAAVAGAAVLLSRMQIK